MRFVDDASLRLHSTALHGSLIMIRQMVLTLQPIETSPSQMMPKAFTQIDAIKACINLSQSFKCLIASEQTKAIYMPTTPRPDSVIEDRSMNWGIWCQKQISQKQVSHAGKVIASHSVLWNAITYPCLRNLLAPKSSIYPRGRQELIKHSLLVTWDLLY